MKSGTSNSKLPAVTVASGLESRKDNFLLLRIIAAVLVIYGHSFPMFPGSDEREIFSNIWHWGIYSGDIAVDIFFVVSGFMVSGSYMRRAGLFQFLKARILRIVPALLVCLLISAYIIGPLVTTLSMRDYFNSPDVLSYVWNDMQFSSAMQFSLPGVFETNAHKLTVNGSLWTLPAEFRMYVFVAILGALGLFQSRVMLTLILAALWVIALINPGLLPLHPMWVRLSGFFVLGILIQLYREKITISHEAMVALAFMTFLFRGTHLYPYSFAITLAYFCFWFGYRLKLLNVDAFGDPSYGAYLWGWPVLQLLAWRFPGMSPHMAFVTAGLGALLLGYVSWHLVERQVLRLKSIKILPFYKNS
ncbi:acyltransferase [Rhodanobacter sp. L36]|uniref:acyltransferase family protein n=1 Tax=Rhodanobacter sp. L36 TaxID=1747221 RepID=UPI00131ADB70|nr:acyltransferase [Rhodanobacter sp. L36]